MNILKKFKYLVVSMFAFLFIFTLASCNDKDNNDDSGLNDNPDIVDATGITDDDPSFSTAKANISATGFNFDTATLSSINIDVSKAKTTFYLGDDFSSEGVVVKANFLATIDGERKVESFETTDFSVDSSKVDMYNIGSYPVEVTYRYKATVNKTNYTINVISSELANSGEEYVGGIQVKYNGETEYSIDFGKDFDSSVTKFSVTQHFFVGETETSAKTIASKNYSLDGSTSVSIDTTAVNTNRRGDYIVTVTYTPEEVYINGANYSYSVKAFIIVHVIDKIKKVEFQDGTLTFAATATTFDYSDWNFQVRRENSGVRLVNYGENKEDFVITGVVPFITGPQVATVRYLDYEFAVRLDIVVTPSEEYNIVKGNIYDVIPDPENPEANICSGEIWDSSINTAAKDAVLDSSGLFKINKPSAYATDRLNSSNLSKDVYGSLYFGHRPTIKGADSYISVEMENPGILVVYAASTGTTQRDVCVFNAPNSGEEVDIYYTPENTTINQYTFVIEEAGTYYIQSFEGGIYVHGVVVAIAK